MSQIIKLKVNPQDISFINKIFEAYNGLALVSTIDNKMGLIKITTTPDTYDDVVEILKTFPKEMEVLS